METEYLKEFAVLAKKGSYFAAAEELYISQPTLSKHIKRLEKEIGATLFERSTRSVALSLCGQALLPYAERIAAESEEAAKTVRRLAHDTDESLRLGVIPFFIPYGIQQFLFDFKAKYSDYSIGLTEAHGDELLRMLEDGKCNLIMLRHDAPLAPQYRAFSLAEDEMVVVVPHGHPLDGGAGTLPREKLDGLPVMTTSSAFVTHALEELEAQGIRPDVHDRINHSNTILSILPETGNAALLMRKPTEFLYGGKFRLIGIDPPLRNTLSFVALRGRPMNAAVRAFLGIAFPDGALD